ncbi:hypothetical protein JGU66_19815 [Myxococcaceae bacterium JPH2]|nr:hypothetical protein [Myxococcaceae bacterium JPH2]
MVGALLCLAGCSGEKNGSEVDAGTEAPIDDANTPDSGIDDAGTPDAGPAPCEKTRGVCGGAQRAMVDGVYESVCTALSYGPGYEEVETRCDDLDNDCDGVADPSVTRTVTRLNGELHSGMASSLAVADGILVAVFDTPHVVRVLHVDRQGKLMGVSEIPLATDDPAPWRDSVTSQLVRTNQGPALFYARYDDSSWPRPGTTKAFLRPLTETGASRTDQEEQAVFARNVAPYSARATSSTDGTALLTTWREISPEHVSNIYGLVQDVTGQTHTGPTLLFSSATSGLYPSALLGLRNGEFLVVMEETLLEPIPPGSPTTVHVRRFDRELVPIDPERVLVASEFPNLKAVELGAGGGDPHDSIALVMRDYSTTARQLTVLKNPFAGGRPELWAETLSGPNSTVFWTGARASPQGLQVAWLAKQGLPPSPSPVKYHGWLWTQSEGYAAVQQTPQAEPIPLVPYAQWVLLEDVGARRQAAFYMRSDEKGHTLEVTRTCLLP